MNPSNFKTIEEEIKLEEFTADMQEIIERQKKIKKESKKVVPFIK